MTGVGPTVRRQAQLHQIVHREGDQHDHVHDIDQQAIGWRQLLPLDLNEQEGKRSDGENKQEPVGPFSPTTKARSQVRRVCVMHERTLERRRLDQGGWWPGGLVHQPCATRVTPPLISARTSAPRSRTSDDVGGGTDRSHRPAPVACMAR